MCKLSQPAVVRDYDALLLHSQLHNLMSLILTDSCTPRFELPVFRGPASSVHCRASPKCIAFVTEHRL
jgi:hypothetical protein